MVKSDESERVFDLAALPAVVLAGGRGTRLASVLPDCPKILAPIAGRPFIEHVLDWLADQGIRRIVFSLGIQAAQVIAHLEARHDPTLRIATAVEPEPLGTAGGLALASSLLDSEPALVMNGDSLVEVGLSDFLAAHRRERADVSVVAVRVPDGERFGSLVLDPDGHVRAFHEKSPVDDAGSAWINAGVYAFSAKALRQIRELGRGSLERDFFATLPARSLYAFRTSGHFMDIGTPASLARAETWFRKSIGSIGP